MIDPWTILGWLVLALAALLYVGGILQVWSANLEFDPGWRRALAFVLALIWSFGIGAAVVKWLDTQA